MIFNETMDSKTAEQRRDGAIDINYLQQRDGEGSVRIEARNEYTGKFIGDTALYLSSEHRMETPVKTQILFQTKQHPSIKTEEDIDLSVVDGNFCRYLFTGTFKLIVPQ